MNNIKWNYFVAAAEEKNFTRAAEKLFISQQSLSNYIAKLEAELGTELFNRKNTLTLTAAGESLYRNARRILAMEDLAKKEIMDIRDFRTSSLRIGISLFRGSKVLPKILPELKKQYPDVKIELVEKNLKGLRQELIEGRIDLVFGYAEEWNPEIIIEEYHDDNMLLVIPESVWNQYIPREKQEELLEKPRVELKEFASCPFVMLTEGNWLNRKIRVYCEKNEIELKIELRTYNLDTMVSLALAGLGACVCPEIYVREEYIGGICREPVYRFELEGGIFHPIRSIQYKKNRYLPKVARDFIEIVKKTYPVSTV